MTMPRTGAPTDPLELLHAATDRATIVRVPERRMFAFDGLGSPDGPAFLEAVHTLHAVTDLLRADLGRERHLAVRLGPVEAAWWIHPEPPDEEVPALFADRRAWHWQLMVEVPSVATGADVEGALAEARREGVPDVELVRLIGFAEGLSAQILHVGGPDAEPEAVRRLYEEVARAGLAPRGHLHEIHLADVRRVPAERRRTILRLPIEPGRARGSSAPPADGSPER